MSNALSVPPPIGTAFSPQTFEQLLIAVNALYGTLTGQIDKSGIANATGFDDDGAYAWTIQNQGSGGHLKIPNVLDVGDTAVTVGLPLNAASTLAVTGTTLLNGAVSLGDAAGDAITVNGTPTFKTAVTFENNVSVLGNTALGNANTDTVTVIGVTTYRNAANTLTQLFVDAGNNRVIVGSATALGSDTTPNLQVVGRLYVAPDGAGNDQALFLRHNTGAVGSFTLGATNAADPSLIVKDTSGDEMLRVNPSGATYALDVNPGTVATNAARFTGDVLITTDLGVNDIAATGGITAGTTIAATGGISAGASSAFTGGISVVSGGVAILGGGLTVVGNWGFNGVGASATQSGWAPTGGSTSRGGNVSAMTTAQLGDLVYTVIQDLKTKGIFAG